jgi:hypothetical protein
MRTSNNIPVPQLLPGISKGRLAEPDMTNFSVKGFMRRILISVIAQTVLVALDRSLTMEVCVRFSCLLALMFTRQMQLHTLRVLNANQKRASLVESLFTRDSLASSTRIPKSNDNSQKTAQRIGLLQTPNYVPVESGCRRRMVAII